MFVWKRTLMTVISVRHGNRLHLLNESLFYRILQCFFSLAGHSLHCCLCRSRADPGCCRCSLLNPPEDSKVCSICWGGSKNVHVIRLHVWCASSWRCWAETCKWPLSSSVEPDSDPAGVSACESETMWWEVRGTVAVMSAAQVCVVVWMLLTEMMLSLSLLKWSEGSIDALMNTDRNQDMMLMRSSREDDTKWK